MQKGGKSNSKRRLNKAQQTGVLHISSFYSNVGEKSRPKQTSSRLIFDGQPVQRGGDNRFNSILQEICTSAAIPATIPAGLPGVPHAPSTSPYIHSSLKQTRRKDDRWSCSFMNNISKESQLVNVRSFMGP